jgi:hypothetical protein
MRPPATDFTGEAARVGHRRTQEPDGACRQRRQCRRRSVDAPFVDDVPIIDIKAGTDEPDVQHTDVEIIETEPDEANLSARDRVAQTVYLLQKNHGVKIADLKKQLPAGAKDFPDLDERQATEVLPSLEQLLESKQAG